jgi:hypothetical protein
MKSNPTVCIFCKRHDRPFKSIGHIIPESLGNRENVFPPGIVCDICNNYFGSKSEGPILASDYFKAARFRMSIHSKKKTASPLCIVFFL